VPSERAAAEALIHISLMQRAKAAAQAVLNFKTAGKRHLWRRHADLVGLLGGGAACRRAQHKQYASAQALPFLLVSNKNCVGKRAF
jgi:hypothetical protein